MSFEIPVFTGECPSHSGCTLDFFCNDHFALCCEECRKEGGHHQKCNVVPYGSVDLQVVQSFLPKVTKKLERELTKTNDVYMKALSEREAELKESISQAKESIYAYFRALEIQRDELISQLDRLSEKNDYTELIQKLSEAEAAGAGILACGKRAIAEWDSSRGKEMVQTTSDVLLGTRAFASKVKVAEPATKCKVSVCFSPAYPEPLLGNITTERIEIGKSEEGTTNKVKREQNDDGSAESANKRIAQPYKRPQEKPFSPRNPPTPPFTAYSPSNAQRDVLMRSKARNSGKKLVRSPSPTTPSSGLDKSKLTEESSSHRTFNCGSRYPKYPVPPPLAGAGQNYCEGRHDSNVAEPLKFLRVFNNSVFVENLPPNVSRRDFYETFPAVKFYSIYFPRNDFVDVPDSCSDANKWAIVTLESSSDVEILLSYYDGCIMNGNAVKITKIPRNSVFVSSLFDVSFAETLCEMFNGIAYATLADRYGIITFESGEAVVEMLAYAKDMDVVHKEIDVVLVPNQDDTTGDSSNSLLIRNVPKDVTKDEIEKIFEDINIVDIRPELDVNDESVSNWVVKVDDSVDVKKVVRDISDTIVIKSEWNI